MLILLAFAVQSTTNGVEGEDAEIWEPVSPRKHISQRRRTADDMAERAAKQGTLYDFPAHTNTFASLEEETREDELVEQLCSDTQEEGDGSVYEGSFLGGTRYACVCSLCGSRYLSTQSETTQVLFSAGGRT